jgi:hypothetical protein
VERRFDAVRWRWQEETSADEWVVRHLERMPQGTPVTERRPVVDMLQAGQPGCGIAAVWITGGHGERFDGKVWPVPKLELPARLQTLLESKRLRIAERMREAGTLGRELLDIKSARRARGRLKVGAEGVGEHTIWRSLWRWPGGSQKRDIRLRSDRLAFPPLRLRRAEARRRPGRGRPTIAG